MRHVLRKGYAVIIAAVLIFTTVFSLSAVSAVSFTPRTSAPASSNKYYYSDINIFYKYGYGMPNCTAYAYGRAYEILGKQPNLSRWSAEYWYGDNIDAKAYKYGSTPKLGAIACWKYSSGGGHVAVVEKIENGTITFSNSAYGGSNFYLTTASTSDKNAGGASWWTFQGYIYIIDSAEVVTDPGYKAGVYRTDVSGVLNMRSGAGTSYAIAAKIPNNTKLTITEFKDADGYTWGKTSYSGKSGWVAMDYVVFVSAAAQPTTAAPTTVKPTTQPTTAAPTMIKPTTQPTTAAPTTVKPITQPTTAAPTTVKPTTQPTTAAPTTAAPTTVAPTTAAPTTVPVTEPAEKKGLGVGDINMDNTIDVNDVTLIQKVIAEYSGFTEEQISWCDFNFDGEVTVEDVTAMQKYLSFVLPYFS